MSANGSKKSEIINSSKVSISVVISEKLELGTFYVYSRSANLVIKGNLIYTT